MSDIHHGKYPGMATRKVTPKVGPNSQKAA